MTTMDQVMERVARLLPNTVDERDQARWLMELDGRVYEELTRADEPDRTPAAAWPEDGGRELLIPDPYGVLYELWLMARICFVLGQYADYNNLAGQFEATYSDLRARWRRDHVPAPGPEVRGVWTC